MRSYFLSFLALGVAAVIPASAFAADKDNGRYIVVLKDGEDADGAAKGLGKAHGLAVGHVYSHALNGFAASMNAAQAAQVAADKRVSYVAEDLKVSTAHVGQVHMEVYGPADGQTIPTGIKRIGADGYPTGSHADVDVAVIDTGIDLSHPQLNVVQHVSFLGGVRNDNGGQDGNGHGTHVSGTIAAKDDSGANSGVVGVVPGARLWAVKVLDDSGSGYVSDIVKGIDYVDANAATIEVANMSLGGKAGPKAFADPMHDAIKRASSHGVIFCVAAGNDGQDSSKFTPANYSEVITVSAIVDTDGLPGKKGAATKYGGDDTFASFSNFGTAVDIAAPGVNIISTWTGGGYGTISGTSMATPHVTGAVALYLLSNPKPTNQAGVDAVKNALINLGWAQTSANGFTGDPDKTKEKLLSTTSLSSNAPVTISAPN